MEDKLKLDPSPIYENNGDYELDLYEPISYIEFRKEIFKYENNKMKILAIRKNNSELEKEIEKLRKEERRAFVGSGFWVEANT